MFGTHWFRSSFLVLAVLVIGTATVSAQQAELTGLVTDDTGGVLPGVSVVAASPALLEQQRETITDGTGRFNLTALSPGLYNVSFTLPGFSVTVVEGLDLTAGVTTTANAQLAVGGLEETVTVSGVTPTVDIQNVKTQASMDLDVLEALPSGQRDLLQFASLTLGVTPSTQGRNDVGGSMGDSNTGLTIHGGRGDDGKVNYAGMNTNSFHGDGGGQMRIFKFNTMAVGETVIDTGGAGADTETGGANINMIPREGSNSFAAKGILAYTNEHMASGKVSDALIARGSADDVQSMRKVYDYGASLGGAFIQDKLWYFGAARFWGGDTYAANNHFDKSATPYAYEADLDNRAYGNTFIRDGSTRFSWQAAEKHKVVVGLTVQRGCNCWLGIGFGAPTAPRNSTSYTYTHGEGGGHGMILNQYEWVYPVNNNLLVQAGASFLIQQVGFGNSGLEQRVRIRDGATGYTWGGLNGGHDAEYNRPTNNFNQRFSLSYVTGSHQLEIGALIRQGNYVNQGGLRNSAWQGTARPEWNAVNYDFYGGVPLSLTQFADPVKGNAILRSQGIYIKDQWTLNRLTLNLGLRYDHFNAKAMPMDLPAGPFQPVRSFPGIENIPNFSDIAPRFGIAYDVFGNGRTAIKGSWGKYLFGQGGDTASNFSPSLAIYRSTSRGWNDANGDFSPNCDLTNFSANGECAAITNPLFGSAVPMDEWRADARDGFGLREYSLQTSIALQHELFDGLGLTVSYHRTEFKNHQAILNSATSASDYGEACFNAPSIPELPRVSGKTICGIYDVNYNKLGQVANQRVLVKDVNNTGNDPKELFNGLDLGVNARFDNGALLLGGVTFGRTTWDYCWQNEMPHVTQIGTPAGLPRDNSMCEIQGTVWDGVGSQIKFQVVYPLPFDITLSGSFKNMPGIPVDANYSAFNFELMGSLGRDMSQCTLRGTPGAACSANTRVNLAPVTGGSEGNQSGDFHEDRLNQIDLRAAKGFEFGPFRVQGVVELYNVLNLRPAQGVVESIGGGGVITPFWRYPYAMLGGRLIKFGGQVDF